MKSPDYLKDKTLENKEKLNKSEPILSQYLKIDSLEDSGYKNEITRIKKNIVDLLLNIINNWSINLEELIELWQKIKLNWFLVDRCEWLLSHTKTAYNSNKINKILINKNEQDFYTKNFIKKETTLKSETNRLFDLFTRFIDSIEDKSSYDILKFWNFLQEIWEKMSILETLKNFK